MLIVQSRSTDIYRNLAMEELLMEVDTTEPVLFLWQSSCAVVMGKNQNPWRECRLDRMRDDGVPLARRISGGGTVFHDGGNLNYCVIVDRAAYQEAKAYKLILRTLEKFGVIAEREGKSNLCIDGDKFSGNAFCFRKNKALHHGTLLVNTDLGRLNYYLGSMFDSIETRAISSIPAKVCNLSAHCPELSIEILKTALQDEFVDLYEGNPAEPWDESDIDSILLKELEAKLQMDGWLFESTPEFKLQHEGLILEVEKGIVISVNGNNSHNLLNTPFSLSAFSL